MSIEAFLCTGNVVDFFLRKPPKSSKKDLDLERSPSPNNSPTKATSFFTRIVEKIASITNPARSFTPEFNPVDKIFSTDILKIEEKIPSTIRKSLEPGEKEIGEFSAEDAKEEEIQLDQQRWNTLNILLDNEGNSDLPESYKKKYRLEHQRISKKRSWISRADIIKNRIQTADFKDEKMANYKIFFSGLQGNDYEQHLIVANVAFYHILSNYNATEKNLSSKLLKNNKKDVKTFLDLIFECLMNQHRIDENKFNLDISRYAHENVIYKNINWFFLADYFLVYSWNEVNIFGLDDCNLLFECMLIVLNIEKKDAKAFTKKQILDIRGTKDYIDLIDPKKPTHIPNLVAEYIKN